MTQSLITPTKKIGRKGLFASLLFMAAFTFGCSKQPQHPDIKTYSVTVNYNSNLDQMIQAGKYDYVNDDITADHFPATQVGKQGLEVVLVHFDRNMESADVLSELGKLGLRAATLPELLTFGETHPEVQRQFPIIALGSFWRDRGGARGVPYLDSWDGDRGLSLYWFGRRWGGSCRFAAVRK